MIGRLSRVLLMFLSLTAAARASGPLVVCDDDKDPLTLDPHRQFSEKNHTILQQIYEGLVRFTPDGQIEPALAQSWSRSKDDPLRIRFVLRRGVRFHNGEPFNADAVKFTISRYLDEKTGFPARSFIDSIASVEVVDEHTVDFVTKYPDGLLLNRLAGFVLIVPPRYFHDSDEKTLSEKPVGTGPFRFERWDRGREIRLLPNGEYWNKGFPKVGGLVFRFVPINEQVNLLLSGGVDVVTELPGTMTAAVQGSGTARVMKEQTFWTAAATMNIGSGPLSDVRVRQAMNLAIDRAEIVKYDARGNGQELASLTMPGQTGHDPGLKPYPLDVAKASSLLDQAGVQRPIILKTLVRTQAGRAASILKSQLAKIGVDLDVQAVVADADVLQRLNSERWDLAIGPMPDPMCHSFFTQSVLLYSKSPFSLMKDPTEETRKVDGLLERMASALDTAEQDRVGRELDRYVYERALSLFTYQRIKTYGVAVGVRFTPTVSGMPYFYNAEKP